MTDPIIPERIILGKIIANSKYATLSTEKPRIANMIKIAIAH